MLCSQVIRLQNCSLQEMIKSKVNSAIKLISKNADRVLHLSRFKLTSKHSRYRGKPGQVNLHITSFSHFTPDHLIPVTLRTGSWCRLISTATKWSSCCSTVKWLMDPSITALLKGHILLAEPETIYPGCLGCQSWLQSHFPLFSRAFKIHISEAEKCNA